MTREEAIGMLNKWYGLFPSEAYEALDMAIKALEDIERWRTWSHTYDNLISRQDAIDAIERNAYRHTYLDQIIGIVNSLPSADIQEVESATIHNEGITFSYRKTGEWIWSPKDKDGTVSGCCSNCSFSHLFIGGHTAQYNYCPNCGAVMEGGEDE